MTENDNIRHYIGDLEATEDIDLVFKHIYDLMLANGGEGSGLNADMVDGYHASDFAPASIIDEIANYIHTIYIDGDERPHQGNAGIVTLKLLAQYIKCGENGEPLTTFLQKVSGDINAINDDLTGIHTVTDVLSQGTTLDRLLNFMNENIKCIPTDGGEVECYLDANSVNGLSFILVTQQQYDTLYTKEQKENPRNIFIINDDIGNFDTEEYAAPSLLQAGMNLQFAINENTQELEYSIDKGKTWKPLIPLVAGEDANRNEIKGLLHPAWLNELKTYIDENDELEPELKNQNNYPFLLNDIETSNALSALKDNITNLGDKWVSGIKLDNNTTYQLSTQLNNADVTEQNLARQGILDISLDTYLNTWINNNTSALSTSLDLPEFSDYELKSNKVRTYGNTNPPATGSMDKYISEYVFLNKINTQESNISSNTSAISSIQDKSAGCSIQDLISMENLRTMYQNRYFKVFDKVNPTTRYEKSGSTYSKRQSEKHFCWIKMVNLDYISLVKRNGIAQLSIYAPKSYMYKNPNYYQKNNDGTYSSISCLYEVPIFKFPKSFTPWAGTFYPNITQSDPYNTNPGFKYFRYYHVKPCGDSVNNTDTWLTMQVSYPNVINHPTEKYPNNPDGDGMVIANFTYIVDPEYDTTAYETYDRNNYSLHSYSEGTNNFSSFDITSNLLQYNHNGQ